MPSAKSGKAGKAVPPDEPKKPKPADEADPGEMAKLKAKGGPEAEKYQTGPVPFKESEPDEEDNSWIEIELVDEEDDPIPGEKYRITLPDGRVAEGTLDQNGFKRLEGIPPGTCQIIFPKLDKDAWEKIS